MGLFTLIYLQNQNIRLMKNIAEYLKSDENEIILYHENGEVALNYYKYSEVYWTERTYDEYGNQLTFKDSEGCWGERTYDEYGNQLTYKN